MKNKTYIFGSEEMDCYKISMLNMLLLRQVKISSLVLPAVFRNVAMNY